MRLVERCQELEAQDFRGEAEGIGFAHLGEERFPQKTNSSLPVQPPVQCCLITNMKQLGVWLFVVLIFFMALFDSFFFSSVCDGSALYVS